LGVRFNGYDVRDDNPINYFDVLCVTRVLKKLKQATKDHKLHSLLNSQQEYAKNILYSGGDINTVNID
jgi:hypothetical protein